LNKESADTIERLCGELREDLMAARAVSRYQFAAKPTGML
jgi:hypothetical protein